MDRQLSLLITDDDRAFRETLQTVFRPLGFRTLLAADGEEALTTIHHVSIDLLLVDLHMPRLNGIELLGSLQILKPELPTILISARVTEVIREQAYATNAALVLSKPISAREITQAVISIIGDPTIRPLDHNPVDRFHGDDQGRPSNG
jgi:CheY-like chemotaxis protein